MAHAIGRGEPRAAVSPGFINDINKSALPLLYTCACIFITVGVLRRSVQQCDLDAANIDMAMLPPDADEGSLALSEMKDEWGLPH